MASKTALIGSAGSKEDLQRLINERFYYSDEMNWIIQDDGTVYNQKTGKTGNGVHVRQKGNRWRFEMEC